MSDTALAPASGMVSPDDIRARAEPIINLLLSEERLKSYGTSLLLDRFVRELIHAGLPLDRVAVHIQQLHPQLVARGFLWSSEAGGAVELGIERSIRNREIYERSPIKTISEGGAQMRRRLEDPSCALDYPILDDLKRLGATDYAIYPLMFAGGKINAISIATLRPGGFSESDLAILQAVMPAFASILELRQLRRTARDLLTTYVGPKTGERIMNGTVRRGDGELIHAVLWYCDLRGFTDLSEREPLDDVIALLNDYFDRIAQPVAGQGGEILKFIGDAMLAIFPCEPTPGTLRQMARAALEAAGKAQDAVVTRNVEREAGGIRAIDCGIALHIGEVMYGNVGAADRLDFTVIGPAVNLVSRLEPMCADLGVSIVCSSDFVRAVDRPFRSLGRHELKGITRPTDVFTIDRAEISE